MVLPSKLTAGPHYYVYTPHAMYGMKGKIIVQSLTGIPENEIAEVFSIYPNPATCNLNIKFVQDSDHGKIKLMDNTGRVVLQKDISTNDNISVKHLTRGLYHYKFQYGGKTTTG